MDRHFGRFRGRHGRNATGRSRVQPDVARRLAQRHHVRVVGRVEQSLRRQRKLLGDDFLHRLVHDAHRRLPRALVLGTANDVAVRTHGGSRRRGEWVAVLPAEILQHGGRERARAV